MVSATILLKMIADEHTTLISIAESIHSSSDFMGVVSYFTKHTIDEEQVMRDAEYPHYAEHKAEHSNILLKLTSYQNRHDVVELRKTVNDILEKHIANFDMALIAHLSNLEAMDN